MKAKLITNGGFSKTIEIKKFVPRISFPFTTQIKLNSPELYGIPVSIGSFATFEVEKKYKNFIVYKQIDAVVEIK